MRRLFAIAFGFSFIVGASVCAAQEPLPLRYAQTGSTWRSVFSLPMRVAVRMGFFEKHGLKFTMVPIEAGAEESLVALRDDKADVAHVATSFLITAALKGSDTVAIAAEFNNPIYSLVAKPWYKSIPELKGRRIGMADMSGAVSLATLELFKKHGLTKDDLKIRVIEGTSARFQCLTNDDCEAVPLGQPQDFFAQRQGYRLLGATNEAVAEFVYTVTAARKPWADAHKEELVRYVQAMRDAFRYVRDPANRAALVFLMNEWWKSSEESSISTLDLFFNPEKNVLPMEGEISVKGVEQVIQFLQDGGVLQGPAPAAERFIDRRFLDLARGR